MIPLSHAQARIWLVSRLDDGAGYRIPVTYRLHGELDVPALAAALGDVVDRHESMRTIFPESDGIPHQVVLDGIAAKPVLITIATTEADLPTAMRDSAAHVFDLTTQPPVRITVFRLGNREHVLLILLHHIAADGWSLGPLLRDLGTAYTARRRSEAPVWEQLPVQYIDYTLWQRELLGDETDPQSLVSRQFTYWRDTLEGMPDHLDLPTDRPRPAVASHRGATLPVPVGARVHQALLSLARQENSSLYIVLQAGLAAVLTRLGAGTDIPIATAIAGRTDDALDDLIGAFVNTLILRTGTAGDPTFRELVRRVRETNLSAYAHQDLPFEQLVKFLSPARSAAQNPLFQLMLVLEDGVEQVPTLPGLTVTPETPAYQTAKFDLAVHFQETRAERDQPGGLNGTIEYATDLFDAATVARLATYLVRFLGSVAAMPDQHIGHVDILTAEERAELLRMGAGPAAPPVTALLPQLLEEQVARTPDAVAVVCARERIGYRELNARANRFARTLRQLGIGPEQVVALRLPRCVDLVVAMLGVLKTGAAYLPIDPEYPAERTEFMLADAAPALLVTSGALTPVATTAILDVEGWAASDHSDSDLTDAERTTPLLPAHAAYVIYTSGSTGQPKGVVVQHRSLVLHLQGRLDRPGWTGLTLMHQSVSFDMTVESLFSPLLSGGRVHITELTAVDADAEGPPAVLKATPSHLDILDSLADSLSPTKCLILGGEELRGEVLARWRRRHPAVAIINSYGPTEITVNCAHHHIEPAMEIPAGAVPIGRPRDGVRLYILDDLLGLAPMGTIGELYVAGAGVARGYLKRPSLTAQRFIADPYGPPGARMYRTGDRVRWLPGFLLEFLGRSDDQAKIRGYRVEPGEIAAALNKHPEVRQAAVLVDERSTAGKRLVGYVVLETPGTGPDPARVRSFLASTLPAHMVPSAVVVVDRIPLTPNGKLDRSALPSPTAGSSTAISRTPRNLAEAALCRLFADLVGVDEVGIDDNFFELGGHSLLAPRLILRARDSLGLEFTMKQLFMRPTVAGLLDSSPTSGNLLGPLIRLRGGTDLPLWCLHPGSGLGWSYTGLLPYVPAEHAVYALQARGLDNSGDLAKTFAALVDDYCDQILAVQPRGPYLLVGWSFGGTAAQAIAVRLRGFGHEVKLLAVIDAWPAYARDDSDINRQDLRAIAFDGGELPDLDEAETIALLEVASNNTRLLADERPPAVYDGSMVLFESAPGGRGSGAETRWRPYVTGKIQTVPVDAEHLRMMRPASLSRIGPVLAEALSETGRA